jgi:DNA-binding HxlR family transcriptional regulator
MTEQEKQYIIIINTLVKTGIFSISEIENQTNISRSWLSKILRRLVVDNILIMTTESGANVKYKLANNKKALEFLFRNNESLTLDQLAKAWGGSLSLAKKNIKNFVDNGNILKQGLPPQKIIYQLVSEDNVNDLSDEQKQVLNKYYAYVTPDGQLLKGVSGFLYWAKNKSDRLDIKSLAQEYLNVRKKFYNDKNHVFLIDATEKIGQVFKDDIKLTKLFHRDFDSLPIFGKTYLSQMIRIAKAGRTNKVVMTYIVDNIRDSIQYIIKTYHIDAIGFIPPTVMRKTQLMTFISKKLRIDLPVVLISKKTGLVPVQQKSLKKIEDRILNANKTIIITNSNNYNNILLIDDVTGSGSTLNETARKLLNQKLARKVYGFTITGSAKANDFDVISEA